MRMVEPEENIRRFFLNTAILRCHPRHGQDAGSSRGGWWPRYNPVARSMILRFVNPADARAEATGHSLRSSQAAKSVVALGSQSKAAAVRLFCFHNYRRRSLAVC